MTNNILHIFAQYSHHGEARIEGTREGLEALAAAIKHALKYKDATSKPVFVNDGEGYTVEVKCVTSVEDLESPYIFEHESRAICIWQNRAFEAESKLSRIKRGLPSD